MSAKIISVVSQKGGVTKSTTCINLGVGLARHGKRVLLVDNDPQGSMTISLGFQHPEKIAIKTDDMLSKIILKLPIEPGEGILRNAEGVDLMPSGIELAAMEMNMTDEKERETIMKRYLETVRFMRDVNLPDGTQIRIPITNLINEQIPLDTKKKVEVVLDMKAQQGMFIGPKAPFGYKKADFDHNRLVPDQEAAAIVKKIFALAAEGMGVTGIVRHLNQHNIPTPIQYARSKGLEGNYDDGNGVWNSRSVKYILTNRVYTGMLVQGKERRAVSGTHEPLVSTATLTPFRRAFKHSAFILHLMHSLQKTF